MLTLMRSRPTMHLTVGLPGVGKTTLARRLERDIGALRLTPDEWMIPLFGESQPLGKRDTLEGRLIWVGHQVLRAGCPVILDFGCWSRQERYALRAVAELAGADFELHYLTLGEAERRSRHQVRWRETPEETFELTDEDHEGHLAAFSPPTQEEMSSRHLPAPPPPFDGWAAWASNRWPSLPRVDRAPHASAPARRRCMPEAGGAAPPEAAP